MILDHSPVNKIHIGNLSGVDLSPAPSWIKNQANYYLLACRVEAKSPLTLQTYSRRIASFIKFMDALELDGNDSDINSYHIRLFLASLQKKGCKASTINSYYRALQTFFNWLVAENIIVKSPMFNIKPPRIPKTKPQPFSRQDIENLLLLCSGNKFLARRNRAIILLFLDTGLRLAELANIQLSDMDFDRGLIKVMGKGAKERVVRMGKRTQKALLQYLLSRNDSYPSLWVTEERTPLSRHGLQTAIKRLCHRAAIADAKPGPHTFRHTAAISFLRNGGSEFTLQIMLGHSTLQMTRRYVSTLGEDDMIRAHEIASPVDNLFRK